VLLQVQRAATSDPRVPINQGVERRFQFRSRSRSDLRPPLFAGHVPPPGAVPQLTERLYSVARQSGRS